MKRLLLIGIAIFLLAVQWHDLDHVYHDHVHGETCDYCLHHQPLDNALSSSGQVLPYTVTAVQIVANRPVNPVTQLITCYHNRAPPSAS